MFLQAPSKTNQPRVSRPGQNHVQNTARPGAHGAGAGLPLFLQKSPDSGGQSHSGPNPTGLGAAIHRSRQGGSALPDQTRQRFESSLGADLSAVRVHNEPQHHLLAKSLHARAMTIGSDILFSRGRYTPGSREGDRLLAHELTHVIQQSSGNVPGERIEPGLSLGVPDSSPEQDADRVADMLMAGRDLGAIPGQVGQGRLLPAGGQSSEAVVQRDEEDEEQGFDVSLLPPELSYRTGPFGISADTSAAQLSLFSDEGRASLGYEYGGDIFYGASMGDFRTRFGLNPQTGVGSMSLGGSHGGFRYGLSGSTAGTFGLNLGYGAPLLPMPSVLGQQAGAAWEGATAVGGAIPEFASNPMEAYEAYRDQFGAMGAFGQSLSRIYGQQGQGGLPFGAGLSLSYNPEQRWVLSAGLQGSF